MVSIEEEISSLSNPFLNDFLFDIEMEIELEDGITSPLEVKQLDPCIDKFALFKTIVKRKENESRGFLGTSICRQIESTFSRSF